MIADIEYFNEGMFTRFIPNTKAGEVAWREMANDDGIAAVFSIHAKIVISQLRNAGYTVHKSKPIKMSDDQLLAELFK